MKMKEFGPRRRGGASLASPLDPPMKKHVLISSEYDDRSIYFDGITTNLNALSHIEIEINWGKERAIPNIYTNRMNLIYLKQHLSDNKQVRKRS